MKVLVTGATGFVGRELVQRLQADGHEVRAAVRGRADLAPGIQTVQVGDLGASPDCRPVLDSCDVVVHLAARVHVMREVAADPLEEFRRVNVAGTLHLAKQAIESGVPKFIFLSSIKVNGEETLPQRAFTAADAPNPLDAYGVSKLDAEQGLRELARTSGMQLAILRTPLVYGPGVKANFQEMMRWLQRGIPLPFGLVTHNRRSFIAVDNLVDLIVTCARAPALDSEVFLASDGEDLSTRDLLLRLGVALGRPARLLPVPPAVLEGLGRLAGRSAQMKRLLGSLQVDASETRRRLGWQPPVSLDQAFARTAAAFLARTSA